MFFLHAPHVPRRAFDARGKARNVATLLTRNDHFDNGAILYVTAVGDQLQDVD